MVHEGDRRGAELEPLRPYLNLIARMHLDYRLRSRIDPDDVVQDTYRKALENWDQCRESRKAWLRGILLNHLKDLVMSATTQKNNVDLEVALQQSSFRIDAILVANESSPSQRAVRNEEMEHLAEALAQLPANQQEIVILHHLHEMKLVEAAAQLGITPGAATGLLYRGLKTLNRLMTLHE